MNLSQNQIDYKFSKALVKTLLNKNLITDDEFISTTNNLKIIYKINDLED